MAGRDAGHRSLDLTPATATNPVGTPHTVTATLTDREGAPIAGAPIAFTVAGVNPGTGSGTTNAGGVGDVHLHRHQRRSRTRSARATTPTATPPCEAVASATKDWVSPTLLTVDSSLVPDPVSAGDQVLDTATVTAVGATADNVTATLSADPGGTADSATVSQGSCAPASGTDVTCTIGDLAAGDSATIKGFFTTPETVPESNTFSVTTTVFSDEVPGGVSSVASATENPKDPNNSSGFVPPGGTIALGDETPSPADNTVGNFTLPNTGDGTPISLSAFVSPAGFCGGKKCHGKVVELSEFDGGYNDPLNPTVLTLRYDQSVAKKGLFSKVYEQLAPDGPITEVPQCKPRPGWTHAEKLVSKLLKLFGFGPHSGYANPAPCLDTKSLSGSGDLTVQILVLSGDPRFGTK